MRKNHILLMLAGILTAFIFSACSPVTMTSWHNPKSAPDFKVKAMVIWGMFEKLEYEKPFEEAVADYMSGKGIKVFPALQLLEPSKKYEYSEMEAIFNKAGANCALIFTYEGAQKTETYVEGTTTVYPGYYYNYYNYYNYAWPGYWGGGAVVSSPGYWTTSTTLHLTANLYANDNDELVYTASIEVTDPENIQAISYDIARQIYADWKRIKAASKN
jgi:hypothetical protein